MSEFNSIWFYSSAAGYGGAEVYLENVALGCKERGYKCSIIVNKNNSRYIESLKNKSIDYYAIPLNGEYDVRHYISLFKLLKKGAPDIFHVNLPGPWNAQLVTLVSKLAGTRYCVSTEHLPMFGPSIRHSLFKFIDTLILDRCIAVSEDNVHYLKKLHAMPNHKIDVVHNGIDENKFNVCDEDKDKDDFVLGIVGRLTEQKGHKYAVEAMRDLVVSCNKIKLYIYGDGELYDVLIDQVKELGLQDVVVFHGFVSNMSEVYCNIDLLVMPSTFEALPLTLLESMASSVPVIASKINGIPEVIDEGIDGMLIEPGDIEGLVKCVSELVNNHMKMDSYKKACREKIITKFTLNHMVDNTIRVYKSL